MAVPVPVLAFKRISSFCCFSLGGLEPEPSGKKSGYLQKETHGETTERGRSPATTAEKKRERGPADPVLQLNLPFQFITAKVSTLEWSLPGPLDQPSHWIPLRDPSQCYMEQKIAQLRSAQIPGLKNQKQEHDGSLKPLNVEWIVLLQ